MNTTTIKTLIPKLTTFFEQDWPTDVLLNIEHDPQDNEDLQIRIIPTNQLGYIGSRTIRFLLRVVNELDLYTAFISTHNKKASFILG